MAIVVVICEDALIVTKLSDIEISSPFWQSDQELIMGLI